MQKGIFVICLTFGLLLGVESEATNDHRATPQHRHRRTPQDTNKRKGGEKGRRREPKVAKA